ncbi:MAG: UvrD-helicase domain-containing protein [Eubacterium sp.]|nr:UvrD-helicase domain-containing protein [Eubacterium sp.]
MGWNKGQQAVLDSLQNDKNVLVSAAAGSGKTAVLVQRIIDTVKERKAGIDEILVVTFTRAAAAQMKGKIVKKLEEEAEKCEDEELSKYLYKQLGLSSNADISTIDSFCNRVVKENFNKIGIDPSFGTFDQGEKKLLESDILDETMDELYRNDEEVRKVVAAFLKRGIDDSDFKEVILKISGISDGFADPDKWLKECEILPEELTDEDINQLPWVKKHVEDIKKRIECYIRDYKKAVDHLEGLAEFEQDDKVLKVLDKLIRIYKEDEEFLTSFILAKSLRAMIIARDSRESWERMPATTKLGDIKWIKDIRTNCREEFNKGKFLFFSEEEIRNELNTIVPIVNVLLKCVNTFRANLMEEKKRLRKYEFSDIAHFTYNALFDKEKNAPSKLAEAYSEKYKYIYIDEYQDSSDMQENILNSVARKDENGNLYNIFMVGDVKQSIYRFRQARPQLFLSKENTYLSNEIMGTILYLNMNYRSSKEILDGVNFIFEKVMRKDFGGIEYDENVKLNAPDKEIYDANFPKPEGAIHTSGKPEILIVKKDAEDSKENEGASKDEVKEEADREPTKPEMTLAECEASVIADRIDELINGDDPLYIRNEEYDPSNPDSRFRKAEYKDVVILLRSIRNIKEITAALGFKKIPVAVDDDSEFFDAAEILTILSILKCIDNIRQDVPYASFLLSKITGITDEEMAYIVSKIKIDNTYLFDKTKKFMEDYIDSGDDREREIAFKLKKAMDLIKRWKKVKRYITIAELLEIIYRDTDYDIYVSAMPEGNKRLSNLISLKRHAENFEAGNNKGLFDFLRYIEKLKIHSKDFSNNSGLKESGNVVHITTIHSSKGLEYPVVFVSKLGKKFNEEDLKKPVAVSADYHVIPKKIREIGGRYRLREDGLFRKAINEMDKRETLYEELRILYVAFTRAKEKLILTGTYEVHKTDKKGLSYSQMVNAISYMDFIRPVIRDYEDEITDYFDLKIKNYSEFAVCAEINREKVAIEKDSNVKELDRTLQAIEDLKADNGDIKENEKRIKERYDFVYPQWKATKTKAKMSVSEIKKYNINLSTSEEEAVNPSAGIALSEEEAVDPSADIAPETDVSKAACLTAGGTYGDGLPADGIMKPSTERPSNGAQYGTLVHKVMELLPFREIKDKESYKKLIEEIIDSQEFTDQDRQIINVWRFINFYSDDPASLIQRMIRADKKGYLYKERQFVAGIPADELPYDAPLYEAALLESDEDPGDGGKVFMDLSDIREKLSHEDVVIQGIIDGYFYEESSDGKMSVILLDYKTDSVKDGESLANLYRSQMYLYAHTIEDITKLEVSDIILYGFKKGIGEVKVNIDKYRR